MDKSSITWTKGADWWLSRTTMGGKERYPKQIRVGDLDSPRVYYPVDRDALLALAKGLDSKADDIIRAAQHARFSKLGPTMGEAKHESHEWRCIARRIREALGASDG